MMDTREILIVPKKTTLRRLLRHEARRLVIEEKITPPVPFDVLQEKANGLLKKLSLSADLLNFTIVLISNESWRDVIAATPYNRRLFLLPQCLRKSDTCKGTIDELGLICSGCRACNIDELISEAEMLGYNNLVAEGTTMAVGLVEEGAIDAVIGVTCMEVLEKSYTKVSNAAVPVIGIPLLFNGCKDTQVDVQWLKEDLHQLSNNRQNKPIAVSTEKDRIHDYFREEVLKKYFSEDDPTVQKALSMLTIGGQRIRPLLSVLAYKSYCINADQENTSLLALIIECFHKASLIHDDIEDGDQYRYEQRTMHIKHGTPIAINIGDYLIGKGYQLLSELDIDPKVLNHAIRMVAQSHVVLSMGQGADLELEKNLFRISVEELESIYARKTGEAIKVALCLGGIIGGASDQDLHHLRTYSDHFGIAYQIRDDLNEFKEEDNNWESKHFASIIALLAEQFDRNKIDRNTLAEQSAMQLKEIITEKGTVELTTQLLKRHVDSCYAELNRLQNLRMKLSLYRVMAKIFRQA